ncbi:hypothetical protein SMKI_10G2800 [Saccharomyces mikatae IFO 1815]|uniref:IAP repeat-containing protein n=1 Tax=Saccharomyces mikatae IFO 1815 TaxID=226126 RepID=A0AA35IQU5_SACMI|nr:uncharacterized protein SMKI_10G2800 [Saccharomyces mikatae IFO 1815]CAI4034487.1 hypothetical protein SMKI_10G2800 [Saccharomyces mikatae IFO 1815]
MNDQIDKMENRYTMTKLEDRFKTFQDGVMLDRKKLRWSFKVIPYQAMAKLGFYFDPVVDPKTSKLRKDSVGCCYCRHRTYDIRECRSKRKDVLETLSNIMRKHLTDSNSKQACLLIYLRNKLLTDHCFHMGVSDWKNDKYFSNPDSENVVSLRKFTFENNWPHNDAQNAHQLDIKNMVDAGLVRYNFSVEGLSNPNMDKTLMNDSCYCIYCKQLLQGWSIHDDPVKRHYEVSKNGDCYFFQTRNRFEKKRYGKTSIIDASETSIKNDEIIATLDEKREEDVMVVKSTSQRQDILSRSPSSSIGPPIDYDNRSNNSVIQHNTGVLRGTKGGHGKQVNVEEKEQINSEGVGTFLEGQSITRDISLDENDTLFMPSTKKVKRPNADLTQLSSPIRKRRKFKRISPRKIYDDDGSDLDNNTNGTESKDKDLVIDFTSHIIKTRDVGRKNAILDDSTDEFSFSNQGHSTFDIPIPTSSHLLRGIDSDNNIVTQEDIIGVKIDTKGESFKEGSCSVKTEEDVKVSGIKPIDNTKNANILIKVPTIDRKLDEVNTGTCSFSVTSEPLETHGLSGNNFEKVEARIENSQYKNDATIRKSSDTFHSGKLCSISSKITTTPKGKSSVSDCETSDVFLIKRIPAEGHSEPKKKLEEPESLPLNGRTVATLRKLDNINIDVNLSASDFSISSHSEQSSKSSSAISTPIASPKINYTRSIRAVKELSGVEKEIFYDKGLSNNHESMKTHEDAPVKNETLDDEVPFFETGTPISSQENKSKKLFDEEFLDKCLDVPIDTSTVEIRNVHKTTSRSIPPITNNSMSATEFQPDFPRIEEQRKEINTNLVKEEGRVGEADAGEWFGIDENRLLVKNYFHDLLKYINNNDATLANDKDGDLAFLIKQMPNEELEMTFNSWVDLKVQSIKREFIDDCDKKLNILRSNYYTATTYVENLEDDDELIKIAKKMGIL